MIEYNLLKRRFREFGGWRLVKELQLMKHWNEEFDQETWNKWTSKACFHKLSSRPQESLNNNQGTIYQRIINYI